MEETETATETEDESIDGGFAGINWAAKRRSFLKRTGGAVGLAAIGGTTIASTTVSAAEGSSACFQVDLVQGHDLKDPLDSTGYSGEGRLINWIWGEENQNTAEDALDYEPFESGGCTVETASGVELDYANSQASVDVQADCTDDQVDLALVAYCAPCDGTLGWDPDRASEQEIFDQDTATISDTGTLTVDLPVEVTRDFEEDLADWEALDADFQRYENVGADEYPDTPYSGAYAGGIESGSAANVVATTEIPCGDGRIETLSWYYYEVTASHGGGLRVQNSSGEYEAGMATDNPQWYVSDNGQTVQPDQEVYAGDQTGEGHWIHVQFQFDWGAGEFDWTIEDLETGHTETGTHGLAHGEDVAEIHLANFNRGGDAYWNADGDAMHMWFDGIEASYATNEPT